MELDIYIKINDPIWLDAFGKNFKAFVIVFEKNGKEYTQRIPLSKILQYLEAEHHLIWQEAIDLLSDEELPIPCEKGCKKTSPKKKK